MTWFGWFILGVLLGFTLAALLVVCVGRESEERGGTLDFTSRDARGVFTRAGEASTQTDAVRTWRPEGGWPLPLPLPPIDTLVTLDGYTDLRSLPLDHPTRQ